MTEDPGRPPGPPPGETPGRELVELPRDEAERRAQRPLAPTIILLLVAGGVLLAIGLWTGRDDRQATPPAQAAAALTILEPADSARIPAPLEITFATTAPLRLTPMGWQAGRLHLHAIVDGVEVMPGALDIRTLGENRFRWRLKSVGPGPHDVRLVWARPDHRAIPEGASGDVPFTVTGQ